MRSKTAKSIMDGFEKGIYGDGWKVLDDRHEGWRKFELTSGDVDLYISLDRSEHTDGSTGPGDTAEIYLSNGDYIALQDIRITMSDNTLTITECPDYECEINTYTFEIDDA